MQLQSIQTTAADIIWRAVELFAAAPATARAGLPRPTLATAACWAVRGEPCQPRDLTDLEAAHVAEVCDTIEDKLGMTLPEYEALHAGSSLREIAWDLGRVAWELDRELRAALSD